MKKMAAKELLVKSFHELAEKKPIDKITIKDITDNCGYSAATFYRNFSDKYDLIAWDYAGRIREIVGKIGNAGYQWKQTLHDGMVYFWDNRDYLKNLLLNTSGQESFIRYMSEINVEILTEEVQNRAGTEKIGQDIEIFIQIFCFGTIQLVCKWLMNGVRATSEQMAQIFEEALPDPLKMYLL